MLLASRAFLPWLPLPLPQLRASSCASSCPVSVLLQGHLCLPHPDKQQYDVSLTAGIDSVV